MNCRATSRYPRGKGDCGKLALSRLLVQWVGRGKEGCKRIRPHQAAPLLRATTAQFTKASAMVATGIRDWPKTTRVTRTAHRIMRNTAKQYPAGSRTMQHRPSG